MNSPFAWLEEEVKAIPGRVIDNAQTDVSNTATDLWGRLRTDVANAVNQLGAAATSGIAGKIAPAGSQPVTIPLSSGQVLALVIGVALLIGGAAYLVVRK